jgi:hypothetical protein
LYAPPPAALGAFSSSQQISGWVLQDASGRASISASPSDRFIAAFGAHEPDILLIRSGAGGGREAQRAASG